MPQDLLPGLRARRTQIQEEMRIRIDELDRLIALVSDSESNPNQAQIDSGSRRRRGEFTINNIFELPILNGLLGKPMLTTKEMATLLPGKKIGPLVSAWRRRARTAGVVFDDLVERTTTPTGDVAFSLTEEGRLVFGSVVQPTLKPTSAGYAPDYPKIS